MRNITVRENFDLDGKDSKDGPDVVSVARWSQRLCLSRGCSENDLGCDDQGPSSLAGD